MAILKHILSHLYVHTSYIYIVQQALKMHVQCICTCKHYFLVLCLTYTVSVQFK